PLGFGRDRWRASELLDGVPSYDRAWRALRRDADPVPFPRRLADSGIPTLVIVGAEDDLVDRRELADLGRLAHVRVRQVPGGHYVFLDSPGPIAAAVEDFLRIPGQVGA